MISRKQPLDPIEASEQSIRNKVDCFVKNYSPPSSIEALLRQPHEDLMWSQAREICDFFLAHEKVRTCVRSIFLSFRLDGDAGPGEVCLQLINKLPEEYLGKGISVINLTYIRTTAVRIATRQAMKEVPPKYTEELQDDCVDVAESSDEKLPRAHVEGSSEMFRIPYYKQFLEYVKSTMTTEGTKEYVVEIGIAAASGYFSYVELAELFNLPEGTAKSRIAKFYSDFNKLRENGAFTEWTP